MKESNGVWQMPVKESNFSAKHWVHHWSKYHFFVDGAALCGNYWQDTEYYYQHNMDEKRIMDEPELACKKCLTKKALLTEETVQVLGYKGVQNEKI